MKGAREREKSFREREKWRKLPEERKDVTEKERKEGKERKGSQSEGMRERNKPLLISVGQIVMMLITVTRALFY